jgi:hypothetical protein
MRATKPETGPNSQLLAFDDLRARRNTVLGLNFYLGSMHLEDPKHPQANGIRRQNPSSQRRQHRTYQFNRITHREVPQPLHEDFV